MQPTFKPGQLLYVRPAVEDIAVGDVIVFKNKTKTNFVVHRVIKIDHGQFFTRGDNNPYDDPDPVHPEEVLGVVKWADQDGTITAVRGGNAGFRRSQSQKCRRNLVNRFMRLFFPLYRFIKSSEIIPKLWHPEIKKIQIKTENGVLIKYLHRNHTVAQWDSGSNQFDCRHLFDLVIKTPDDST